MIFTINVNVSFPGLLAFLSIFKGNLMSDIKQALNDSTDKLVAEIASSKTKIESLIQIGNTTKDALVALQAQVAAGSPLSADDIQAVIDKQSGAVASLTAIEGEVDTATGTLSA